MIDTMGGVCHPYLLLGKQRIRYRRSDTMDVALLMQLRKRFEIFRKEHPKMIPFLKKVQKEAYTEGSVVEIKVTSPEGKEYVSNLKVTANDIESLNMLLGSGERE